MIVVKFVEFGEIFFDSNLSFNFPRFRLASNRNLFDFNKITELLYPGISVFVFSSHISNSRS